MRLGDIFVALRADDSKLKGDLDNAKSQTTSWASGLAGSLKGLIGGAVVGGVTALVGGIAGIGVAAFNTASDLDKATDLMTSKLGTTAEGAENYRKSLENIFANNFGDSIEDVADSLVKVESAFKRIGGTQGAGELEHATQAALALRDAFGAEVNETTSAAVTLMDNFGLSAVEAFDFVTKGYQKGLNASDDFLDTIGEYGTQFANGGADAAQFFNLMESGMQGGMLGTDKAADAFKEFRVRIQDGSTLTAGSLEQLGINSEKVLGQLANGQIEAVDVFEMVLDAIRKTDNSTIAFQAGVGLLGTQFEDLGEDAVKAMSLTGETLDSMAGSVDKLNKQYDNLPSFFEGLRRRFVLAITPIGDALLGVFNDSLPTIEAWFSQVETWIKNFIALSDFTWEPDFKQIKLGDLFEWVQSSGVTKLTLGDFFDLTTTPEFTKFTLGDFFSFVDDAGKKEINIGEYVSFYYDKASGGVALTLGDVFTFTTSKLGTAFNLGEYISFFYKKDEKFHLKLGEVYELTQDENGSLINLADWLVVGYDNKGKPYVIKVGELFTLETEGEKETVTVGNFYTVEKDEDGSKLTLDASWFFEPLDKSFPIKWEHIVALTELPKIAMIGLGSIFGWLTGNEVKPITQSDIIELDKKVPIGGYALSDFFTWLAGGEPGEVKITAKNLFDFTINNAAGIVKLKIGDFIDLTDTSLTSLFGDALSEASKGLGAKLTEMSEEFADLFPIPEWVTNLQNSLGGDGTGIDWAAILGPFDWGNFIDKLTWPTKVALFAWEAFVDILSWPTAVIDAFGWGDWVEKLTWPLTTIASFAWSTFVKAISWPTSIFTFSWSTFVKGIDLKAMIPAWPGWTAIFEAVNPFGDPPAPNVQSDGSFGQPEEEPFDPNSGSGSGFGRSSSRPTKQAASIYIENVYVRDERDADMFAQTLAKRMAFG